jgi:hypothetical protein
MISFRAAAASSSAWNLLDMTTILPPMDCAKLNRESYRLF